MRDLDHIVIVIIYRDIWYSIIWYDHRYLTHTGQRYYMYPYSLPEHSSKLDIIFYVNTHYTRYCYSMYKYHCYTYTITRHYYCMFMNHWYTDTLLHRIALHGYSIRYYSMFISLFGMYALIVSVFLLRESLFILHEILLHGYSCILITRLFPVTDIDIPVTGHVSC